MLKLYAPTVQCLLAILMIAFSSVGYSQVMQLEVVGGNVVTQGSTISINAGNSLDFRITNIESTNCSNLKIDDNDISIIIDFNINLCNSKVYIVQINTLNGIINRKVIIK